MRKFKRKNHDRKENRSSIFNGILPSINYFMHRMTKQEILKAFKQAEVDWCKPIKYKGLCSYFVLHQNIRLYLLYDFLIPLWLKYSTEKDSLYHFKNNEQRLDAIRKVIHELENEL